MDEAKATYSFPDGRLQIEGSPAFVTDCITKMASQRHGGGLPSGTTEKATDHAWGWFSLHASHRMQAVNFFLVAAAFLSAAYVSALNYNHPVVAAGVGILGFSFSVCFYLLELRIRELLKAAEAALTPLQSELAERMRLPALKLCEAVETPKRPYATYHRVIKGFLSVMVVAFSGGILYALYIEAKTPAGLSLHDELLFLVIYRGLVVAGAVAVLTLAQRLVTGGKVAAKWPQYLLALAFTAAGIVGLIVTAIQSLR